MQANDSPRIIIPLVVTGELGTHAIGTWLMGVWHCSSSTRLRAFAAESAGRAAKAQDVANTPCSTDSRKCRRCSARCPLISGGDASSNPTYHDAGHRCPSGRVPQRRHASRKPCACGRPAHVCRTLRSAPERRTRGARAARPTEASERGARETCERGAAEWRPSGA